LPATTNGLSWYVQGDPLSDNSNSNHWLKRGFTDGGLLIQFPKLGGALGGRFPGGGPPGPIGLGMPRWQVMQFTTGAGLPESTGTFEM
jgi:hypothetical protein